jgi:hypothetical protein
VRLRAELVEARELVREVRAAAERREQELTRARDDLAAERQERTADAERFRAGIAEVRMSAEQALDDARDEATRLTHELAAARDVAGERDAALSALRDQLEAAHAERERAVAQERAEADGLRHRVKVLEEAAQEARASRADVQQALDRLTRLVDRLVAEG